MAESGNNISSCHRSKKGVDGETVLGGLSYVGHLYASSLSIMCNREGSMFCAHLLHTSGRDEVMMGLAGIAGAFPPERRLSSQGSDTVQAEEERQ